MRVEWLKGASTEWRLLGEIMSNERICKVSVDIQSKAQVLRERDVILAGALEDPGVAVQLLSGFVEGGLEKGSKRPVVTLSYPSCVPPVLGPSSSSLQLQISWKLTCYRSIAVMRVMAALSSELRAHNLLTLFTIIEMPIVSTIADAEFNGIPIQQKFYESMLHNARDRIQIIEFYLKEVEGNLFNISSPADRQQLKKRLLQQHQCILNKRSIQRVSGVSKGCSLVSTMAEANKINTLDNGSIASHPLLLLLSEHSLLTTSIIPLCTSIAASTHMSRVCSTINAIGTETGRMTFANPPLQRVIYIV
jgi:DNA polymerase I-like protein with 3'-5' exonuclease and polymerase domains